MSLEKLRLVALYHAEQAGKLSEAAHAMGESVSAAEFREKADWHRETAQQLDELARAFATFGKLQA